MRVVFVGFSEPINEPKIVSEHTPEQKSVHPFYNFLERSPRETSQFSSLAKKEGLMFAYPWFPDSRSEEMMSTPL
jgi:hypothetical protein